MRAIQSAVGDLPPGDVGAPDVADLALADQVGEHRQRLLDRRDRVGEVELVEVDPVGAQPLQRRLDRSADVAPRAAGTVVGTVGAAHVAAELGGHHEPVAPALEGDADHLLALADAVGVGGVEERDPGVVGGVEDAAHGVEPDPAAERVAADPDRADHQARVAQRAVGHLPHPIDPTQALPGLDVWIRSRSRTQKPWCSKSSSSTVPRHCRTDRPRAYGGQRSSSGIGAWRLRAARA